MADISGTITVKVQFNGLLADDDSEGSVLDAVFADGWEGDLDVTDMDIEVSDGDEDDDEDE